MTDDDLPTADDVRGILNPPVKTAGTKGPEKKSFCSFCGKSQNDVKRLIAGPTVLICDDCVDVCYGMTADVRVAKDKHVERVIAKHRQRAAVGLNKYGVTTERDDLSKADWLRHLQEELLDAAVYVEAALAERPQPPDEGA